ncbi:ABC transporter permease [Nocardioides immobilis]|uniref:ABC transporter permease n=1 Tax=Nocardioides immobilis TaxID=2049295 RepID=A0A417Y5G2_9ACTN|nr:ABC transporter permease [Nocardioides immobilis]RHW27744.1 ABC transporter permease [Nocardioides immobilis]
MNTLAWASLRHRPTAFVATFLAVLLGTAMIGSFATLLETAGGPVSTADEETLTIMGAVVGGWGSAIVLFSVASTLAVTVRQRETEVGLLRAIGATPRQARRLIRAEALLVTVLAAIGGALVAAVGGRALLALLRSGDLVSAEIAYGGGPASLAAAACLVVATATVAAAVTARRATRGPATVVLRESGIDTGRMRWWRVAAGVVLVGYGLAMAAVTITVTADSEDPYAAMQTAGASSILVGVGLALFAPVLLRLMSAPARTALGRSASGHLASYNVARRSHLLASVLAPVIVLTSSAIGTLMLVGIDGRTLEGTVEGAETINLLNNVVVGMIALFAAIMVVNAIAAAISHRRSELRRLWLVGATPAEVERSVVTEAAIVAAVGVLVGAVASLATIMPFAIARDEGPVPDGQLWLPPLLVVGVVALTLTAARGAVRPALRQAVHAGATGR